MKQYNNIFRNGAIAMALACSAISINAAVKATWGDFKLWIDPGHSTTENGGLYGYTEAQKVLRVGLATRDFLKKYTDITDDQIKMTRENDTETVSLDERSDMANAWGADFFYSIHSDSGGDTNQTLFLFGGWNNNGVSIEKTPNGGKRFGEILDPNLTGVMYNTTSRGNWYDRCYYERDVQTHDNQFPYLSVNRRTTMASLLSEGGFHTNPVQQPLNMNESYKKLEAFGTARAILKYRGIACPDAVILAGIVKNSENNVPIDNVSVTVGDSTIVTDSYTSLFNKYTKNQNLIHNGFYMFDNLTPKGEYTIKFSAPGYDSDSLKVTLSSDPQGDSGNNVTWGNISLTANKPAMVSSISIDNPQAVNITKDILITFSRFMNKESVENAFSINNAGVVTKSWDNEYTLRLNISKLLDAMDYTIKIDGSIAKNAQTNQFFDGDGDGNEGGDYTFSFTTQPTDTIAPYIVGTSPAENTTMLYTYRPVVRIEYNEKLNWNDDLATDLITVEDKDGTVYPGTLKHEVINENSVLHYFFATDLPKDKCFKVTVKGGLQDMAGNVSQGKVFKFLSEYHAVVSSVILDATTDINNWYQPHGSGTSDGWRSEETNTMAASTNTSGGDGVTSAFLVHYDFDPETQDPDWRLRIYKRSDSYRTGDGIIQAYVYGDGSNNMIGHCLRDFADGAVKLQKLTAMDFRGWGKILTCSPNEETFINISGTSPKITGKWKYDAFFIQHFNTDDVDTVPQQAWIGDFQFDDLKFVKYDATSMQTAKLDDISLSGVEDIIASDITIAKEGSEISVTAPEPIRDIAIYSVAGINVRSMASNGTTANLSLAGLQKGVYIVRVATANKVKVKKMVIK